MSKEETSNHILDTAIDLFWRASYHGVNMNELSRAADLNKATVYQYFGSKEKLAVAAVERAAERTRNFVFDTAFERSENPVDRLKNIYKNVYQTHKAIYEKEANCIGCPFVNIGVELATSSDDVRTAVNKAFESFHPYYKRITDDYQTVSVVEEPTNATEIVSALLANMNACLVASKLERRPEAILEGSHRAINILKHW
ncbi:hypothetical protein A9Q83_04805 [Alphaproteobacteria bacterium 46_93_T64]|nr:hypothetical protein A9Q83_04805 [Alphaproteobacteria bacterium 46_93_T64]